MSTPGGERAHWVTWAFPPCPPSQLASPGKEPSPVAPWLCESSHSTSHPLLNNLHIPVPASPSPRWRASTLMLCKPTCNASWKVVEMSDAPGSLLGRVFTVRAQCASCLIPDPGALPLQEQLQHFSLCWALKQQLHRGTQRSLSLHRTTALTAPRELLLAQPLQEIRHRGRQGHKETKTRAKWCWARSSLELKPWLRAEVVWDFPAGNTRLTSGQQKGRVC